MCDKNPNPHDVTVTYDLVTPKCNHSVDFLIKVIRSNQYKMIVHTVRQLVPQNKQAANEVKKYLPAATFSCRYEKRRCLENVTHYTGFVLLDADNLDALTLVRCVALLPTCPWVYAYFLSPSGNGLKILVKTNGLQQHHAQTYHEVRTFFEQLLKIKFDACTSDVVRLCFLSHDPNAYLNPGANVFRVSSPEPFTVIAREERPKQSLRYKTGDCFAGARNDSDYVFRKCVRFTNRKRQFVEGNRNNFVFLLSCYCRLNGLTIQDAMDAIVKHYNYSQREIKSAVKSAYRYN